MTPPAIATSQLVSLPVGTLGLDCVAPLDDELARDFYLRGVRFVARYVRRVQFHPYDLTVAEVGRLFDAGLAVMTVQHVDPGSLKPSGWLPTLDKGTLYGLTAAEETMALGAPPGLSVWCDLEGVSRDAKRADTNAYARAWFNAVRAHHFLSGLYVGWRCGLLPDDLYRLPFTRYWGAYNLNHDEEPSTVGLCMKQRQATAKDRPKGVAFELDMNTVTGDALGRVPMAWAPEGWVAT